MVGFNRRFAPLVERLQAELGQVDDLVLSMRVNAGPLPDDHWLHDPEDGGGRLLGEGCHFVDLLCSPGRLARRVGPRGRGAAAWAADRVQRQLHGPHPLRERGRHARLLRRRRSQAAEGAARGVRRGRRRRCSTTSARSPSTAAGNDASGSRRTTRDTAPRSGGSSRPWRARRSRRRRGRTSTPRASLWPLQARSGRAGLLTCPRGQIRLNRSRRA